jgi:hypothetical protein
MADARARLAEIESRLASVKSRSEVMRQADLTADTRELATRDPELVSLKAILLPRKNDLKAKLLGLTEEHQGRKDLLRTIAEIDADLEKSGEARAGAGPRGASAQARAEAEGRPAAGRVRTAGRPELREVDGRAGPDAGGESREVQQPLL